MILAQDQLEALFAGETIDHHSKRTPSEWNDFNWTCRFKPGVSYAACLWGKRASCRVKVLTVVPLGEEGWRLRLQIDRTREDRPVFLQRSGGRPRGRDEAAGDRNVTEAQRQVARGYTHMPSRALRDAGEAIDDETLARYSRERREAHEAFLAALDERPVIEQLVYELHRAQRVGTDSTWVHSVIMRKVRRLRRENDQRSLREAS